MTFLLTVLLVAIAALGVILVAFGDAGRVGVAGTLLGGVIGFLAATISERTRREHEDRHRFEGDRRAVYVRFLGAVSAEAKAWDARHIAHWTKATYPQLAATTEMPARPDTSAVELLADEIQLLAPFSVYASAQLVRNALGLMSINDGDPDKWLESARVLDDVERTFLKRAKADLGTPTGIMSRRREASYKIGKRLGRLWSRRPPDAR